MARRSRGLTEASALSSSAWALYVPRAPAQVPPWNSLVQLLLENALPSSEGPRSLESHEKDKWHPGHAFRLRTAMKARGLTSCGVSRDLYLGPVTHWP